MNTQELVNWLRRAPNTKYDPSWGKNCAVYRFLRQTEPDIEYVASIGWYKTVDDDSIFYPLDWKEAHHCHARTYGQLADLLEKHEL